MQTSRRLAATALLFLVACSGGSDAHPDSGLSNGISPDAHEVSDGGVEEADGGVEEADAAPARTGVTVTVQKSGAPLEDVRVIAHDRSGVVTGDFRTDADGKVTLDRAPSMLTVLDAAGVPDMRGPWLVTYVDVEEGDRLLVDAPADTAGAATYIGAYNVMLPSLPDPSSVLEFRVETNGGCFSIGADPNVVVELLPRCLTTSNTILASARGMPPRFVWEKGVPPPPSSAPENVTITSGWTEGVSVTVSAVNSPQIGGRREDGLVLIADGSGFSGQRMGGQLEMGGVVWSVPPGFSESMQTRVSAVDVDGPWEGPRTSMLRREEAAERFVFDFAERLPFIDVTGRLTIFAPEPAEFRWTGRGSDVPLSAGDGAVAVLAFGHLPSFLIPRWVFVLPASATAVTAPALPSDLTGLTQASSITLERIGFMEASFLEGYAALKALAVRVDAPFIPVSGLFEGGVLPQNGSHRSTTVTFLSE